MILICDNQGDRDFDEIFFVLLPDKSPWSLFRSRTLLEVRGFRVAAQASSIHWYTPPTVTFDKLERTASGWIWTTMERALSWPYPEAEWPRNHNLDDQDDFDNFVAKLTQAEAAHLLRVWEKKKEEWYLDDGDTLYVSWNSLRRKAT